MGFLDRLLGRTKQTADVVVDKVEPVVGDATNVAGDAHDKAKDLGTDAVDKAKDLGTDAVDTAKDVVDDVTGKGDAGSTPPPPSAA